MNKFTICYPCNLPFFISQKWGENYQYYHDNFNENGHNGWDFAVPVGTPIYATHDATVFFRGTDITGALAISLDNLEGTYRTIYGHLSEFKCENGDKVIKGQLIALSGNTGRFTTGPHLHFGIHPIANFQDTQKDNGMNGAVDPSSFFDGTYPNTIPMTSTSNTPIISTMCTTQETPFILMQKAILAFQTESGIFDFKGQPLNKIRFGNKTLTAAKKFYS
jgi:murein DD-endopeptidase MepM/ murein hydrolase activator NlpD